MNVVYIVPCAGKGLRLQGSVPKQFLPIRLIPIVVRTISTIASLEMTSEIIMPIDLSMETEYRLLFQQFSLDCSITFIAGGKERQDSIANALKSRDWNAVDVVVVHDAARPFASKDLFQRIVASAYSHGATVPAVPLKDAVKIGTVGSVVEKTLPREQLLSIQTPQAFRPDILLQAYCNAKKNNVVGVDDSALVEHVAPVSIISGEETNIKVTTSHDLLISETIAQMLD